MIVHALSSMLAAAVPAQTAPPADATVIHADLKIAADHGPVPIEYADQHIVFQAEIGGRRVWVLLDTGAVHDVIDTGLARSLGLPILAAPGVAHLPGGHDVPNQRVNDVPLVVPNSFAGRVPMAALDLSHLVSPGHPIQAILGHDLLSHFIVLVDKPKGELIFVPGNATLTANGRLSSTPPVAITATPTRDRVQATVGGRQLTLTLDTGSAAGLSLSPEAWARVKPAGAQVFSRRSMGATGEATDEAASRLPSLMLGPVTVNDVQVRVSRQQPEDGDGLIGMGVLARYSFVLDEPHGRLWLIPVVTDTSKLPAPTAMPGG